MNSQEKIGSVEKELETLQRRIVELEQTGKKEKPKLIREVLKEHREKPVAEVLEEGFVLKAEEIEKEAGRLKEIKVDDESHQQVVLELLQLAEKKGILNASTIAKKLNDPHLEDDFHDALLEYLQGK